jgi:hypothetical protein
MKTPENNMYEKLKTTMINTFSEPETTKLKKLLHTFELGDKRPSQLLREMQELSDNKFSDDVLKIFWIQRLPAQCQTVVSCFDSELEELASKADKIMQATTNTVINEATADPPEIFQNLQNQVEELIKKVEALNNRPAKNWYNKPTQRRRQDSTPDVRPCWYHMKFGSRAHRCQPPCCFQAENL